MSPETKEIFLTLEDGSKRRMRFITLGRGNALPKGAVWVEKARGVWFRAATAANIDAEIAAAFPEYDLEGNKRLKVKSWDTK